MHTCRSIRTVLSCVAVGAALVMLPAITHAGGSLLKGITSTADGYSTWDADLVNAEGLSQTGHGVYVAVLDTGLVPNWTDYFPQERVATSLGIGFGQPVSFSPAQSDPCGLGVTVGQLHTTTWVGSAGSTHGTHVASTIIGYAYRSNSDLVSGYPLPPILVRGIAPGVTIVPVKVLSDYQVPALPNCTDPGPMPAQHVVFGTSEAVAAGIDYVADLAEAGYKPIVINMSLGGPELDAIEKAAIDRAIAAGVIVVAAAGNEGEEGMGYPGAYAPVISAGSAGWVGEWLKPGTSPDPANFYRMWWLKYPSAPLLPDSGEVADPTLVSDVYVSDFSSRALAGQELDVVAPGSWVRGPFPGTPGFSHLPWWSQGIGDLVGHNPGNFYYVGGTSMATPHVAAIAALMLEKKPALVQSQVEATLKNSALAIPNTGSATIFDVSQNPPVTTISWDTTCPDGTCDPVGSGLVQADAAIAAVP